jgi:NADPH:quinone reductase-like Zn-dependent oxidoreductase
MPHVGPLLQLLSGPASQALGSPHACRTDHPLRRSEVLEIVDPPEPEAGPGQKVYDVSTAGVNYADTHHGLSRVLHQPLDAPPSLWAAEGAVHP